MRSATAAMKSMSWLITMQVRSRAYSRITRVSRARWSASRFSVGSSSSSTSGLRSRQRASAINRFCPPDGTCTSTTVS